MIRKLIAASTILGAVALLSNKARRDRLAETARGLLSKAREKTEDVADKTSVAHMAPDTSKPAERPAATPPPKWVRPGGY